MILNALLVTKDVSSVRCLTLELAKLGIDADLSTDCARAMEALARKEYSCVILDFDLPGAPQVAQTAHLARSGRPALLVAMVTELGPVSGAFQAGIKFVLYKPLRSASVAQSLWDAKQFMRRDRRRSARQEVKALVYLQLGGTAVPALLRDLSEQGLALQAPEPLAQAQNVPLRFVLPGMSQTVQAIAEVIWADETGRAGLFFARITPSSRKYLRSWFIRHHARKKDAVRVLLPPRKATRRKLVTA